jgi:quercetin dioxygenase-like cupin family protein
LIESFKVPEWTPPPFVGFVNVVGKVILDAPDLVLAVLRFDEHGTIPEHPGESEAIVACLEGEGFTSVGGVTASFRAGQRVTWPAKVSHRLWTENTTMTTLMVERPLMLERPQRRSS